MKKEAGVKVLEWRGNLQFGVYSSGIILVDVLERE
jgi:hypothetical protein